MTKKDTFLPFHPERCKTCTSVVNVQDIPAQSEQLVATYNREKICTLDCLLEKQALKKPLLH